jgi:hypothetical protein
MNGQIPGARFKSLGRTVTVAKKEKGRLEVANAFDKTLPCRWDVAILSRLNQNAQMSPGRRTR